MSNTVKTDQNIEVYANDIYRLCDEYINNLEDPVDIKRPPVFRGMLKYIYINKFQPGSNDINYNNKHSNLNYADIDLLDNIWNIYTFISYKYLQYPSILNFSLMTGIDRNTFTTWEDGRYRAGEDGASSSHSSTVKKWRQECEGALRDGATTGNPGPMFLLKANYGYSEQPQQILVTGVGIPQQTAAEIAEKYQTAQIPERPNLE